MWKEGVDTCVFNPAVKCEGDAAPEPNSVSRIVQSDKATRDLKVESLIREKFPAVVDAGFVTIHTKSCTPDYSEQDLRFARTYQAKDDHGCDKLKLHEVVSGVVKTHTNMITPLRGDTFPAFMRKNPAFHRQWKSMLDGILLAAITMVPDDGPWIIHTDCHLGNVLTVPKGAYEAPDLSLSDWGRALIIENPKDINSVRQGIREWAYSISYLNIPQGATDGQLVAMIHQRLGNLPQHPDIYQNAFDLVYSNDVSKQQTGLSKLRSWLPFALITQSHAMMNYGENIQIDVYRKIATESTSQQKLGDLVFMVMNSPELSPQEVPSSTPRSSMSPVEHSGGVYWPLKYYRGLTRKQNLQRKRSATRRTKMSFKNPKAYVPFKSDKGVKTRKSSYTERFHKKYPDAKSLSEIAKSTGISKSILQTVYDRGMAAWRTGHRPGASQHAWGMARVHSFVMKGKTWRTADADLARKV